jgi:thiopeptide-type bacteriocin biosynthesis protein
VPTAGMQITGPEPVVPLIEACDRSSGGEELGLRLRALRDGLQRLDDDGLGCDPARYRALAERFGPIGDPPEPVKLARSFQVDLAAPGDGLVLSAPVARRLADAAALAWRLRRPHSRPDLDRFRDELRARHEHEWVSLTEAVDPDAGIGFGGSRSHEPLLRGLVFPAAPTHGVWTKADAHLLHLLTEAAAASAPEIVLTAADVDRLTTESADETALPDTFTVGATLVAPDTATLDRGDGQVLLTMVTGPSGAELLGRFAHGDATLEAGIRELVRGEEALDPEAIYAELVHLPDPRGANVVLRPVLREWELPYLGLSGAPVERQVHADDLDIAVRGDGLVLRARSLGRRVVPRLSSAHNHTTFGAPLYRLLAALATDDRDAAWTWGPLEAAPFLPRVRHGSVVLARARWRVTADEVGGARQVGTADLDALRVRRRLPRHVVLAQGDNRLVLDLDDDLGIANLRRELRAGGDVRLEELLPGPDELPLTREGRALTHEVLVPFITTRGTAPAGTPGPEVTVAPARDDATARAATSVAPPRTFLPGSEWLYVKLYGGARAADDLVGELDDLVAPLLRRGVAQRWFFIRYADPDDHLRLRIGGDPTALSADVLPAVTEWATARHGTGRITRLTIDTYSRETDRYGGPEGIEPAEAIFEHDSRAVSVLLADRESRAMEKRWLLTLLGLRDLLVDLGFDDAERLHIARRCKEAFAAEHRADRTLTRAIGAHHRTHRAAIDQLMAGDAAGAAEARALAVFAARRVELRPWRERLLHLEREGRLHEPRLDLAASFLHMHANRMLATRARAQELVLYDHLERVERAAAAR